MLRCTIAGLIPLMMSDRYKAYTEDFYAGHKKGFESIIQNKSYYILRTLPATIAERLLTPVLPDLIDSQMKNGMWRGKTERTTYDILAAIKHIDGLSPENIFARLKYAPLQTLENNYSYYSLLIKKDVYAQTGELDERAIGEQIAQIKGGQNANGSWEETVVGTVAGIEKLIALGVAKEDEAIRRGIGFLYAHLNQDLQGIHTTSTYDLVGHHIFTVQDRSLEFRSAESLKPEWLPRKVCFRTLAMIPNAVCLTLFVQLGMERDERVALALENLYQLHKTYGGFCANNIKKPFLSN